MINRVWKSLGYGVFRAESDFFIGKNPSALDRVQVQCRGVLSSVFLYWLAPVFFVGILRLNPIRKHSEINSW